MSKAGGIAYLIKHGRASMPTVTRTPMKGKGYAAGGTPINNSLGYGPEYDYVFVPGGMELNEKGQPVYRSGRFERRAQPAPAAPAADPYAREGVTGRTSGTGGGSEYGASQNPAWDGMSNTEKAAWYAQNPIAGSITSYLQNSPLGKLQQKYDPEAFGINSLVAAGIDPQENADKWSQLNAYNASVTGPAAAPTAPVADPFEAARQEAEARLNSQSGSDTPDNAEGVTQGYGVGADGGSDDGTGNMAHGGVARMATGGIGALPAHGGFVGSYAHGGRMLRGPGDGLSDNIPATISGKQPARLADGEFVVSADVVSALGGGSTEAGSKKLYAMMDRIRKAAHGTKKQVKPVKEHKVLPA